MMEGSLSKQGAIQIMQLLRSTGQGVSNTQSLQCLSGGRIDQHTSGGEECHRAMMLGETSCLQLDIQWGWERERGVPVRQSLACQSCCITVGESVQAVLEEAWIHTRRQCDGGTLWGRGRRQDSEVSLSRRNEYDPATQRQH
jgi:hypothetical protein